MLKLRDILKPESVVSELKSGDKKGVLVEFSELASQVLNLRADEILDVLLNREKLGSTAVGHGVAIPHGKVSGLEKIVAFFGRSAEGVDYQAHDQKPAHLFFVILSPENAVGNYLHILARLSRLMKEEKVRQKLETCPAVELYQYLITEDDRI